MAGRPVNESQREERRREVDTAIAVIKRRNQPVTKKAIAEEMGITIQSLYGAGFLAQYAKELEQAGVIIKERGNAAPLTAAEVKSLEKQNASLQKENGRLKEKISNLEKVIADKDKENADLTEQLEIERGNTFLKKKAEFASRHI
ncbi:MAG: hypothetical protein IJA33_05375 [Oscillospiraceae bacterium]|nr:hypothetical protein [Oscillospiraceae bacterium]